MDDQQSPEVEGAVVEPPHRDQDVSDFLASGRKRKYGRFLFAALGSIPWVGGVISASSALHAEREQGRVNEMVAGWLEEHHRRIELLKATLNQIADRLDSLGGEMSAEIDRRLNDEAYLSLVRQAFRTWDRADTESKRDYLRRCLTNAAATKICSDDVVRLFLSWIDKYDDTHFAVIRVLYQNRGATRAYIWHQIHGEEVREDSAEADLFKLLIFDLNTGRVLRLIREKTAAGQFIAKRRGRRTQSTGVLESAFEDTKPWELTALGSQFVHYVMEEVAPQLGSVSP